MPRYIFKSFAICLLLIAGFCSFAAPVSTDTATEIISPVEDVSYLQSDTLDGKRSLGSFDKANPEYPREALRRGISASIVTHFTVDNNCNITNPKIIAYNFSEKDLKTTEEGREIAKKFISSVLDSLKKWRYRGVCSNVRPYIVEVPFGFVVENGWPSELPKLSSNIDIKTLVKATLIPKGDLSSIDTTKGTCPLSITFTPLQPGQSNRLKFISPISVENQDRLLNWLTNLELTRSYMMWNHGRTFNLSISCEIIDIK